MYLRETKRKNADGSVVRYFQLAHNEWDKTKGCAVARVVYNFGRADHVDYNQLKRLASSILRLFEDEEVLATEPDVEVIDARPYGGVYVLEQLWRELEIDKVLKPNTPLNAQWRPNFLGGVPVIKGKWADGSPLIAIPYYARNNRKATDEEGKKVDANSSVWVKDQ